MVTSSALESPCTYDGSQVEPEEYARAKASSGPLECIALSPFATRLVGAAAGKIDIYDVAAAARGGKASYLIETIEARRLCTRNERMVAASQCANAVGCQLGIVRVGEWRDLRCSQAANKLLGGWKLGGAVV